MFDPSTPVLIADDMLTMRKIVGKSLKELGFQRVTEGVDGENAWELLTKAVPPIGLIVSDWNMPRCTGVEFLKRVRADERFKHIPFLMVTAEAEPHQVTEAVQAGVDNYIVKPFTKDTFREKLEAIHKRRTAQATAKKAG